MASLSARTQRAVRGAQHQQQVPALGFAQSLSGAHCAPPAQKQARASGHAASARSRRTAQVKAVVEKAAIQYTPSSKAKSSSTLAIILGGGAGTRLWPLTQSRAKPAVPIGGMYRLIDVPMSNCINSGINKIYILTQFNSTSLNRHLSRAYRMGSGAGRASDGFVEVLAATQTPTDTNWFQGTADAVRQYAWLLDDNKNRGIEDVVILSGDHLYRMDYMQFVDYHKDRNADVTIGCIPYGESKASEFGLMKIDASRRVMSFAEKPKTREALDAMKVDTRVLGLSAREAGEKPYIASMGIYVFKKKVLLDLLRDKYPSATDFGGEIIPQAAANMNVVAYPFQGYWEDIGTVKSFFEENLKLVKVPAAFEFYDPQSPIYTSPRILPPSSIEATKVTDAIIANGSSLRNCTINNAVIGLRSKIGAGCVIQDAMIMGCDYYESDEQVAALVAAGKVPLGVGDNSTITNAIVDKNARIGRNVKILNKDGVSEANKEADGYVIRSGIVVVLRNGTVKDGTTI